MQAKSSEVSSPEQANSLASRIRWLLDHFRLQQKELALVMDVDVDRVKSLVLGRARTLRREEIDRLVTGLGVMEEWLVDGRGTEFTLASETREVRKADSVVVSALRAIDKARRESTFSSLTEPGQLAESKPSPVQSDAMLLVECVKATETELRLRGRPLDKAKRLRVYWAVFELSLQGGTVNRAAIGPLLDLAFA